MEDEVSVRPCGPEDRAEQARLFNACFKKRIGPEVLAWRYDENPHGRAVSLVARTAEGAAVCGYACSPRRALVHGDETTLALFGQTGDVMTHPDWRGRGIFSGLDRACMQETERLGWPVVFGFPNRRSAPIFLKLGWKQVGTIRPWSFYLRADVEARGVRAREGRMRGALLPLTIRACRRGRSRLLERRAPGLRIERLERFPADVLALSRAVESRFSLMVRRDADYLNWRFLRSPSGLHRAFGLRGGDGALVGYVVVQVPRAGEPVGYLVDALAPDEGVLAAALEEGLRALEEAGAALVQATAVDGSFWARTLGSAGFLPPKPENHLIVILWEHRPEHPLAHAARDASAWYVTDGDRDDETMG